MKRMAIFCSILPTLAVANVEHQVGIGLGTQYGGLAGIKYSIKADTDKVFMGIGFADRTDEEYGITLGWEKALTEKHALGLAIRTKSRQGGGNYLTDPYTTPPTYTPVKDGYESFIAGTYTYYFRSSSDAGFLTGLSVGRSYIHNNVRDEFLSGMEYGLHFGYQF